MRAATAWRMLGIARTEDTGAIRRAYAERLRAMDVDADPDAYERLRDARDVALRLARSAGESLASDPTDTVATPGDDGPPPADTWTTVDVHLPPTAAMMLGTPPLVDASARGGLTPGRYPLPAPPPPLPVIIPIQHDRVRYSTECYGIGFGDPLLTIAYERPNDAVEAAFQTFRSLLQPEDGDSDTPMSREEGDAAWHAADVVLSDPKLSEIDYRTTVDAWMADLLARSIPRSDPLLHPVATFFDWQVRGRTVDASPAVAFITDRIATIDFIDSVRDPEHRFHRAWRALSAGTPDSIRPKYLLSKRRVRALLKDIRQNHPGVEDYLDPTEVNRWDGTMLKGPNLWLWIVLTAVFIRVLIGAITLTPSESQPPVVPGAPPLFDEASTAPTSSLRAGESDGLKDVKADLDMALLRIAPGFDLARVRADNPALARDLEDAWSAAHRSDTQLANFFTQIDDLLRARFDVARRTAGYDDLREWVSLKRTVLQGIAQRGEAVCSDYLRGKLNPSHFLTRDYFRVHDALMANVLLKASTISATRAAEERSVTIPADIVDTITRRTELSRDTVIAALADKSTPRARCQVTNALYDTMLELPRVEALKLMRQL